VLSRTLLFGALALVAVKLFFPGKWRGLGRRVDRLVNAILIAIAVVYSAQLAWWLVQGR
jgi:hypothetical protein